MSDWKFIILGWFQGENKINVNDFQQTINNNFSDTQQKRVYSETNALEYLLARTPDKVSTNAKK